MSKYLYGASVQGIQGFIFQTNKLKEIAGASQLVENISDKFFDLAGIIDYNKDNNLLIAAAGNIKYIFEDKENCQRIVKYFPKEIANYAPGITISQAVVKLDENDIQKSIDELEKKLRIQRNKVSMPVGNGYMGLERARRTGGVGVEFVKNEVQDRGTLEKTKLREENTLSLFKKVSGLHNVNAKEVPFDLSAITKKEENSWLAIIHADGNGLGQIITNLTKNVETEKKAEVFKQFSIALEEANKEAAQNAFNKVIAVNKNEKVYPIRPVVLGGDDLTLIIRADLAYDFTKEFLSQFEDATTKYFKSLNHYGVEKITACAGIAYIKDSYPFHYGVDLAEALTKEAKTFSKSAKVRGNDKIPPSSLAFYKVQASFTEDLKEMIKRTHSAITEGDFFYGPYLIKDKNGYPSVKEMDDLLNKLQKAESKDEDRIAKVRQWLTEIQQDRSKADFLMNRMKEVNKDLYNDLNLDRYSQKFPTILNDLIHLHTFNQMYK